MGFKTGKKGFCICTREDVQNLLAYVKAAQKECMTAGSLMDTLPDACDSDPFKDSRFYVAQGSNKKAMGYLSALIKILEGGDVG